MQTVEQQYSAFHPWHSSSLGPVSTVPESGSSKPLPGLMSMGFRPVDPAAKLGCTGSKSIQMPQDPAVIDGITAMLTQTMRYRGFGAPIPTIDTPSAAGIHSESAAAKVRNHLDLHFQLIRGYHDIPVTFGEADTLYEQERPRYNPLQTIRSRRARGHLPQKFLWAITLSEEISDFSWQQNYFHAGVGLEPPNFPSLSSGNVSSIHKGHRRGPSFSLPVTPKRQSAKSIGSDSDSPYASTTAVPQASSRRLTTPPVMGPPGSSPARTPHSHTPRDSFGSYKNFREFSSGNKLATGAGLMQRLKAKHKDSSTSEEDSDSTNSRAGFSRTSSATRNSSTTLPVPLTGLSSTGTDSFGASTTSVAAVSLNSMSTGVSSEIPPIPQVQIIGSDDDDNQVFPYYGPGISEPCLPLNVGSETALIPQIVMNDHSESAIQSDDDAASEDSVEMIVPTSALSDDQEQMCRAQDQLEYIISVFRIALQQNQNKSFASPCPQMAAVCSQNCEQLSTRVMPKYLEYLSSVESEVIDIHEKLEAGIGQTIDHIRVSSERMGSAVSTTLNRQLRETAARLDRLDSCTESKCFNFMAYATIEFVVKIALRCTWFVVKMFLILKSLVYFLASF